MFDNWYKSVKYPSYDKINDFFCGFDPIVTRELSRALEWFEALECRGNSIDCAEIAQYTR